MSGKKKSKPSSIRTPEEVIAAQKEASVLLTEKRLQQQISSLKDNNKVLLHQLEATQRALGLMRELKEAPTWEPAPVKPRSKSNNKRIATAVIQCSDFHIEERVDPDKVDWKNKYNPDIARQRVIKLAEGIRWLIEMNRTAFTIEDVVIWLGGDLISNYIHLELMESNFMSPVQAILLAQEFCEYIINKTLQIPGIKRLIIPCNYGNHGRTEQKKKISTGAANSFEWLMYQSLKQRYENDSRVEFHIASGEQLYLQIYETTARFCHGDATKGGSNIGGITIPINKAVSRWDSFRYADVTFMGHFHQSIQLNHLMINGSLIGYNPFAMHIAARFEPPQQNFCLIDSERGVCQKTTIWVDEFGAKYS